MTDQRKYGFSLVSSSDIKFPSDIDVWRSFGKNPFINASCLDEFAILVPAYDSKDKPQLILHLGRVTDREALSRIRNLSGSFNQLKLLIKIKLKEEEQKFYNEKEWKEKIYKIYADYKDGECVKMYDVDDDKP